MRILLEENTPWLKKGETLVCFGDSLTEAPEGYVSYLQEKLEPAGIKVINAGLGGDKSPAALMRLRSDVIDLKPDAVSIFFGNNDGVIGRGCWADEPVISPEAFRDNLVWIVHLCRLYGNISKFSINTTPLRPESSQFMDFGFAYLPYARAARDAADLARTLLVPLDAVFYDGWLKNAQNAAPDGKLFTRDGLHMKPEGYKLIADSMLKVWNMR